MLKLQKNSLIFNRISAEFDPLSADQIPLSHHQRLSKLVPHKVSRRIRRFRKSKSMVDGDAFPSLLTKFSDFFAMPLTDIDNKVARTYVWPDT